MTGTVARPARGELVAFVHALRAAGVTVSPGQLLAHLDAVAAVGPTDLRDLYLAGRVTLVVDHRDRGVLVDADARRRLVGG